MIISQTSTATGRLTCATVAAPSAWNSAGQRLPERDAGDDAERHPERQIALENAHGRRRGGCPPQYRSCLRARNALALGVDHGLAILLGKGAALWMGRRSSTASEGRHSFTPPGRLRRSAG